MFVHWNNKERARVFSKGHFDISSASTWSVTSLDRERPLCGTIAHTDHALDSFYSDFNIAALCLCKISVLVSLDPTTQETLQY